ncbi:myosin-10-like isoform X6 [Mytilus californianus]|uniref:myosin-10-like isoform X6 n=1 Tax=Mytilus californianus TaxID=6549 RepID=UPI0022458900|nr:myosin-10-like isoform X6 [Mytilus californianus]
MLDSKRVSTPDRPFHSRTLSEPRGLQGSSQDFYSPDVSAIRASTETRSSLQRSLKDDRRNVTLSQDSGMYSSSSTLREIFRSARDIDSVPSGEQRDEMQGYHNGPEMQGYHNGPVNFSPRHSQIKSVHDSFNSGVFPDSDSGFSSSLKTRMYPEDYSPRGGSPDPGPAAGPLVRARSMSRLNSTFSSQDLTPHDHPYVFNRSVRNLKTTLEDSENRRVVLMHKLKEAQDTLDLQSQRLNKIENAARGNTILVGDLQLKEREYRKTIQTFDTLEQERDYLKMENIRLRQEMQDRIDKLDFQLRSLSAQHQVTENDNNKRMVLLEQSTQALSMLENENGRLTQDKDTLKREIAVSKEAMDLARSKFEPMEKENATLRVEIKHLRDENGNLQKRIGEVSGQLSELRSLTQSMKDENEKLAGSWKSLAEEKQKLVKQLEVSEEKGKDLQSKVTLFGAEKDRLFHEKMDSNNKLQQILVNNEQLERTKSVLEEQIHDQEIEVSRAKNIAKKKQDQFVDVEEELLDYKKANQDLASELDSVRAYYERSLEQISTLESGKKVTQQQAEFALTERDRLKDEVEKLNKLVDNKAKEYKREKEEIEEVNDSLKSELRQLRHDNTLLDNKNQELETYRQRLESKSNLRQSKLKKANEDLMREATVQQQELDTWKDTCDRLTASVSRKENEIQTLSDRLLDMEDLTSRLEGDNKVLKDECEKLSEDHEDKVKLKDENRKLIQERAENEQMIKLLETQKEVLTKSSESSLTKLHDVEQLSGKVEQFRNENEHLRERILELEKVRDDLVNQKEELLASTELIYKKPRLEELENKVEELRHANRQLREINDSVNDKLDNFQQIDEYSELENLEMKEAMVSSAPKIEVERLRQERDQLEDECEQLRREKDSLQTRHEEYVKDYGPEGEVSYQEKIKVQKLNREKEDLEKQVALINGQLLLVESSKKRLDEVVEDLQTEIVHLRKELEEAEKQPVSGPEVDHLQSEIEALREELEKTQREKNKKDTLIRSLKDDLEDTRTKQPHQIRESLDDVGSELTEVKGELHKLIGVIQDKDRNIETLETELKLSKENLNRKERAISEMRGMGSDSDDRSLGRAGRSRIPRRSEDGKTEKGTILRPDKGKESEIVKRLKPADSFMKLHKELYGIDSTGSYGTKYFSKYNVHRSKSLTDKGSNSGDRLQSLISKYRSYGETGNTFPERKIKPLSLSGSSKMGLVTKGRSFGPAAPKDQPNEVTKDKTQHVTWQD